MDKMQIESDFTIKKLKEIVYQLKAEGKISQSNDELERMADMALPYVKKAIIARHKESPNEIARKVILNFSKDHGFVLIIMYGNDCPERERAIGIYEGWIRGTILRYFHQLTESSTRELNDIVNDCWIDILEDLSKFLYLSRLHTWIFRITMNRCYQIIREEPMIYGNLLDKGSRLIEPSTFIDPNLRLEVNEFKQKLHQYIRQICEDMNQSKISLETRINIGAGKFIKGMKNTEIARKYDIKVGTVGSIAKRIKDRIPKEAFY